MAPAEAAVPVRAAVFGRLGLAEARAVDRARVRVAGQEAGGAEPAAVLARAGAEEVVAPAEAGEREPDRVEAAEEPARVWGEAVRSQAEDLAEVEPEREEEQQDLRENG